MTLEQFLSLPLTHWTSLQHLIQSIADCTPSQHHDHQSIQLVLEGRIMPVPLLIGSPGGEQLKINN